MSAKATFSGTASEKATYERAVRLWRAAGFVIRAQRYIRPTLGATVNHGTKP